LPFANDIRYLQFDPEPKFNRDPKDEEADRLMDEFIDRMDIGDIEMPDPEDPTKTWYVAYIDLSSLFIYSIFFYSTKEYLIPEETFNPSVYMIENAIKKRALNGTAPLPELDPRLRSNIELLPQLEEVSKEYGKKLQAIYNVKEGKKKKGY
jgi:hypothetical protein